MTYPVSLNAMVQFLLYCWAYLENIKFNISGFVFSLADVFVTSFSVLAVCMLLSNLFGAGLNDFGYDVDY